MALLGPVKKQNQQGGVVSPQVNVPKPPEPVAAPKADAAPYGQTPPQPTQAPQNVAAQPAAPQSAYTALGSFMGGQPAQAQPANAPSLAKPNVASQAPAPAPAPKGIMNPGQAGGVSANFNMPATQMNPANAQAPVAPTQTPNAVMNGTPISASMPKLFTDTRPVDTSKIATLGKTASDADLSKTNDVLAANASSSANAGIQNPTIAKNGQPEANPFQVDPYTGGRVEAGPSGFIDLSQWMGANMEGGQKMAHDLWDKTAGDSWSANKRMREIERQYSNNTKAGNDPGYLGDNAEYQKLMAQVAKDADTMTQMKSGNSELYKGLLGKSGDFGGDYNALDVAMMKGSGFGKAASNREALDSNYLKHAEGAAEADKASRDAINKKKAEDQAAAEDAYNAAHDPQRIIRKAFESSDEGKQMLAKYGGVPTYDNLTADLGTVGAAQFAIRLAGQMGNKIESADQLEQFVTGAFGYKMDRFVKDVWEHDVFKEYDQDYWPGSDGG